MSDPTPQPASGASAGASNTFFVGAAVFVVAVILSIGMWVAGTSGSRAAVAASRQEQNIAEQLQKIGSIDLNLVAQAAGGPPRSGEDVYKAVCSACHATGVTGAPKLGDAADWGPRIAQGQPTLEQAPIKGFTGQKGVMPPQSGGQYTDYEIIRAVIYMANAGGAKFEEPPPPADAASADEAAK
jgi:cytochrome c5